MGRFEIVVGRFEIFVGRCGSLWVFLRSLWIVVGRCGSLWVVVGRCGSLWFVPAFSTYVRWFSDIASAHGAGRSAKKLFWGSNNFLGLLNILLIFINK